jgi:ABC-type lipoprotein release transport system permease subunit
MNTQVISYRLSTEEVLQLRQKARPGESDSQIAQRLMREALGVSTKMSTKSTTTLDELIESIVEEKLSALAANQNDLLSRLQERLQLTESRLEEILSTGEAQVSLVSVDNVDENVDITEEVKDRTVDNVDKNVDVTGDRLLSGADLAKRLGVNSGTLIRNRAKPNFTQWSQGKDPEQWAWQYVSELERYAPVLSTNLFTASTND